MFEVSAWFVQYFPANSSQDFVDIGDLQYFQVSSFLRHISSPDQLHTLETNCPQLLGEDAELWQAFIARDIPQWQQKNYQPSNPRNWHKVYKRYLREHKEEVARDAEKLRLAMQSKTDAKQANTTRIVTDPRQLPKLPRDSRMVANNGIPFKGKKTGSGSKWVEGAMRFSEGSRTKVTTGESVLLKARREAKEIGRMNKLLTPMGKLGARTSGIQKAPQAMVDEHARKTAPARVFAPRSGGVMAPRLSGGVSNQHGSISASALAERERRLRLIKAESTKEESKIKPTVISDDEDDYEDDEEDGDLFGNTKSGQPPTRAPRTFFKPSKVAPVIQREHATVRTPTLAVSKTASTTKSSEVLRHTSSKTDPSALSSPPLASPSRIYTGSVPDAVPRISPQPGMKRPAPGGSLGRPAKKLAVDIFNRGGAATKKRTAK